MPRDTLDIGRSSASRPARSFVACACFAVGLVVSRELPEVDGGTWFSLACGACALAAATSRALCRTALCIAAGLIGAGWFAARIWGSDSAVLGARLSAAGPAIIAVEGCVVDEPRAYVSDGPLAAFAARHPIATCTLRIHSLGGERSAAATGSDDFTGFLRLRVSGTEWSGERGLHGFPVGAGDFVRVTGTFTPLRAPENPGEADPRLFGAQSCTLGTLEALDPRLFERLSAPSAVGALEGRARSLLARAREQARRAIDPGPGAPPGARSLVLSLLLGIDEEGIGEVRSEFTRLGLAHVLAISGFHLALLAGLATLALRPISRFDAGAPVLVGLTVGLYTLLVPAEAPVVRSAAMVLGLLFAEALGRRYDRLATLGWVTVALLVWRPLDLWSLGFQLSIGLTGVLLWLAPRLNARVFGIEIRGVRRPSRTQWARALGWFLRRSGEVFTTTLLCSVVSLPLIAHTTGLVSPIALLATLVVLPLSVALMGAGFACVLLCAVAGVATGESPSLCKLVLTPLARLTVGAADALDGLPFAALRVAPIGAGTAAALTALAIYLLCYAQRRDVRPYLAVLVCAAILAGDRAVRVGRERANPLAINAIHVAPGDCTLVRSRGEAILIDAGATTLARVRPTISRAARAMGAWRVPIVVITGPEPKFFGGILECVEPLGVRRVVAAPAFLEQADRNPGGVQGTAVRELRRSGVEVVGLDSGALRVGECTVELTPDQNGRLGAVVIGPSGLAHSLAK